MRIVTLTGKAYYRGKFYRAGEVLEVREDEYAELLAKGVIVEDKPKKEKKNAEV